MRLRAGPPGRRRLPLPLELTTTCCSTAGRCRWSSSEVLALLPGGAHAARPRARPAARALSATTSPGWQGQDRAAAEAFWRARARGLHAPDAAARRSEPPGAPARPASRRARRPRSRAAGRAVRRAAGARARPPADAQHRWCRAPGRCCCRATAASDDVVFGATVSGRPAELPGIESMVGLFINTLPVRVAIGRRDAAGRLAARPPGGAGRAARSTSTAPLVAVQGWSDVPRGAPLFESLLVFENYPVDRRAAAERSEDGGLSVERRRVSSTGRNYPLIVVVEPANGAGRSSSSATGAASSAARSSASPGHLEALLAGPLAGRGAARGRRAAAARRGRARRSSPTGTPRPRRACPRMRRLHAAVRGARRTRRRTPVAVLAGGGSPDLRRARRAGQPARPSPAPARRRARRVLVGSASSARSRCVALLGVLKAGGAYVPLDPGYPRGAPGVHARGHRGRAVLLTAGAAGGRRCHAARSDRRSILLESAESRGIVSARSEPGPASGAVPRASPTSSTPRARPVGPRGSRCAHRRAGQPARLAARHG